MSALPISSKNLLAILSLIAVLFGALEHEDLIFQDHPLQELAAVDAESPAEAGQSKNPVTGLTERLEDSGTEGTFRSDAHGLWLGPALTLFAVVPLGKASLLPSGQRPGSRSIRHFTPSGFALRL